VVNGMRYRKEQTEIHATIVRGGGGQTATLKIPSEKDSYSGASIGEDITIKVFFCQINHTNQEVSLNPTLIDGAKMVISPLDENGSEISNFTNIVKSKSLQLVYNSGKVMRASNARVTTPDGVTPLVCRLSVGA
jgi:hypothetical protein